MKEIMVKNIFPAFGKKKQEVSTMRWRVDHPSCQISRKSDLLKNFKVLLLNCTFAFQNIVY